MSSFVRTFFMILLMGGTPLIAKSQEHHHIHARNEIGYSLGPTYSFDHKEWGVGMHLHYMRLFRGEGKLGVSGGVEYIQMEKAHFGLEAGVVYLPLERLCVSALPSVIFFREDHASEKTTAAFGVHFELIYNIVELEHFHLGPSIDYSLTTQEQHLALGVHAAYCF